MRSIAKSIAISLVYAFGAVLILAPFALSLLFFAYGEFGLAAVILGLGLMQALVLGAMARPRRRERTQNPRLTAAE